MTEQSIGKPRAEACVHELADLNRNVHVQVEHAEVNEQLIASGKYQLVVLTETNLHDQVS